jgi:hypothetical protein
MTENIPSSPLASQEPSGQTSLPPGLGITTPAGVTYPLHHTAAVKALGSLTGMARIRPGLLVCQRGSMAATPSA